VPKFDGIRLFLCCVDDVININMNCDLCAYTRNLPIKLSPKKGTRSWYGVGQELVGTGYEGGEVPFLMG
jgi:hypothetical protein